MGKRATYRAAVYVIPKRGDQILLFRRFNTGFGDGQYSFIAGHVEEGESVTATAIREAQEEAGIGLTVADLHFAHILHRHSDGWAGLFRLLLRGGALGRRPRCHGA